MRDVYLRQHRKEAGSMRDVYLRQTA